MKRIEFLPKWYEKEDKKDRTNKMNAAKKELLGSGLLPTVAEERIKSITCDMNMIADTYSRNYEIKIMNAYIDLYNVLNKKIRDAE